MPDKSFVWIMARGPEMSEESYNQALNRLKKLGYDLTKLKKVPQNGELPF